MNEFQNYFNVNKTQKTIQITIFAISLSSISMTINALDAVAYYSDKNSSRVFIIDPRNMLLIDEISTTGREPYPIDKVGSNKVYVSTRESDSLDIIDYDGTNFYNTGIINLTHKPRSVTYNSSANLAAVSGTKKAVMSIIDVSTDTVIGTVGNTTAQTPSDFGGSLATGHPFWVDNDQFLLIDRARREIHLYKVKNTEWEGWKIWKQHTVSTPTSIHHFSKIPDASNYFQKRIFYGMAEGAPVDGKNPSIERIFVTGNRIYRIGSAILKGAPASDMGSHHLGMHPNKTHIYAGSKEGTVHVIDRYTMTTVTTVSAGESSGHTTFNSASGIATQTNHRDDFMTLIDMNSHVFINTVTIASNLTPSGNLAQSHTTSFDPENSGVYYTAAANDGSYLEIDAVSGTVTRTLPLDSNNSYTIQGAYNWNFQ